MKRSGLTELGRFGGNGLQAAFVAFFLAHLVKLGVVGEFAGQLVQRDDHVVQGLLFLAGPQGKRRPDPGPNPDSRSLNHSN